MNWLNFLKGVAIFGVVLVHSPLLIVGLNKAIPVLLHFGAFGCQLFFVISGYLMMFSYDRILKNDKTNVCSCMTFYKKRFFKIAPSYIMVVFFYQLISMYIEKVSSDNFYIFSHDVYSIFLNIVLLHGFDVQNINKIVPGGWFIGTIFVFYLSFPFLRKFVVRMDQKRINLFVLPVVYTIVNFSIQLLLYVFFDSWNHLKPGGYMYYSFINQFPCFLIGLILYQYKNVSFAKIRFVWFVALFSIVNVLYAYTLFSHSYWICTFIPFLLGMSFFILFICVEKNYDNLKFKFMRVFDFFEWCGKMSFSIYYTNFIGAFMFPWLLQKILLCHGIEVNGLLLYLLLIVPIFCLSFMLAPLVEKTNYKISRIIS